MLPDRVSNPGPLTYESGALSIALCSPANLTVKIIKVGTSKTNIIIVLARILQNAVP